MLRFLLCWELGWWLEGKFRRKKLYKQGELAAAQKGKRFLVIGEPDGEYPCGDVTVDLRENSKCPVYVKENVESLTMFKNKQFGAVFVSHVLEHVSDPHKAMAELARVADQVLVAYPYPWRLATWIVPGHAWLMFRNREGGFKFVKYIGTTNVANRYGSRVGLSR